MKLKKSDQTAYGVIGLGRFGLALAKGLAESGAEIVAIDREEAKVREVRDFTDLAYVTSDLSKENLSNLGIQNCSTVIVCIGEHIDASMLTSLNAINLGVPRVIAKAVSPEHGELLSKIGAEVIFPESDMGQKLAKKLTTHSLSEFISLSNEIDISEYEIPEELSGKTVMEAGLRNKYNLNIIALGKGGHVTCSIEPNMMLTLGESMIVIGKTDDLRLFEREVM